MSIGLSPHRLTPILGQSQRILLALTGIFTLVNLGLIFFYVPTEQVMGVVQRIFYIHVPLVWMGFVSFFVVFLSSILYLVKRRSLWDQIAHSSAEVGIIFMTAGVLTGAIWAKPVWGTWWTWDPKLTTTFVLWIIYLGYLMIRSFSSNTNQAARFGAVIGILGFIDVPIVYMASEWWRSLHPELLTGPLTENGGLATSMRITLYFSTLTFALMLLFLIRYRTHLRKLEDNIALIRGRSV